LDEASATRGTFVSRAAVVDTDADVPEAGWSAWSLPGARIDVARVDAVEAPATAAT
jgi:hypothetical protein